MNRNRNQRIYFYKGKKFDHVIQEGKDSNFTKKGNHSKTNPYSAEQRYMRYGMYPRIGAAARRKRIEALA